MLSAYIHLLLPVKKRYPFLISVSHGGTEVPDPVRPLLLSEGKKMDSEYT